jgi:hypothetical protein
VPRGDLLRDALAALILTIAAATIGGCAAVPSTATPSYEPYPIAIAPPDNRPCAGVSIPKLVIGVDSADKGNIWGISATGPGHEQFDLLWPTGFTARKGPNGVEVLEPSGKVAVSEGGSVTDAQVCQLDSTRLRIDAFVGFNMPTEAP